MKKFYVKDCPDHKPVHIWIGESLGMEEKFINKMKPKNPDVLYEFEDTLLDLEKLKEDSEKAFEEYGNSLVLSIFLIDPWEPGGTKRTWATFSATWELISLCLMSGYQRP